jgi:hypothetical protein
MAGVAWETARFVDDELGAHGGRALVAMLAAVVTGGGVYLAVQALLRAPELAWIGAAARGRGLPLLRSRKP